MCSQSRRCPDNLIPVEKEDIRRILSHMVVSQLRIQYYNFARELKKGERGLDELLDKYTERGCERRVLLKIAGVFGRLQGDEPVVDLLL